ncbi:LptF/LptG family permease [Pedobacter sp. MW01-1-1]|uniref:LptF/LptG family permease n=1 Tax=Pedobacter sp. MW01-1-1 TaxID=3383027 RepID=UPI003FF03F8B
MKKIHLLLIKAFVKPFVATFFVVMFILLMFFLFKWIDDLIGKGFEWYTILELMWYASAANVSMALPLSVLLSSIMTFGSLGENYELVAIKSAGISLQRAMQPLFVVILLLTISSFLFSNYMLPKANLKFGSLLYDIRNKKLSFLIKPGVFNNSIPNYAIRVDSKDEDGTLHNIMIYDHKGMSDLKANNSSSSAVPRIIKARIGVMNKTKDDKFLVIELKDGVQYEEQSSGTGAYNPRQLFFRRSFKETKQRFDLSSFQMNRTDPNAFGNSTPMLNLKGITKKHDSLGRVLDTINLRTKASLAINFKQSNSALGYTKVKAKPIVISDKILLSLPNGYRRQSLENASNAVVSLKQSLLSTAPNHTNVTGEFIFTRVEYQRKFTLAASCILLFFIGAPLGAIIRKGGMGLPVVAAISFFLIYHIIITVSEKSAREGNMNPVLAMWFATIVLSPLAAFLTYKATADSALFDINEYKQFFVKLFRRDKKQQG